MHEYFAYDANTGEIVATCNARAGLQYFIARYLQANHLYGAELIESATGKKCYFEIYRGILCAEEIN